MEAIQGLTQQEGQNALLGLTTGPGEYSSWLVFALEQRSRQLQHRYGRGNASFQHRGRENTAFGAVALLNNTSGAEQHGYWSGSPFKQYHRSGQHGQWSVNCAPEQHGWQ